MVAPAEAEVGKKHCKKCDKYHDVGSFNKHARSKDGLQSQCKFCNREYHREYRKKNAASIAERRKAHFQEIKDIHNCRSRKYQQQYHARNRALINERKRKRNQCPEYKNKNSAYVRQRRATDIQYKLQTRLRQRLRGALIQTSAVKSARSLELCGCTLAELVEHLQVTMPLRGEEPLTFEDDVHIDHIIPLSYFDLTDPVNQRIACHHSNLQVLTAEDNLKKADKLPWPKEEVDAYVAKRRREVLRHMQFESDDETSDHIEIWLSD